MIAILFFLSIAKNKNAKQGNIVIPNITTASLIYVIEYPTYKIQHTVDYYSHSKASYIPFSCSVFMNTHKATNITI